MKKIIKKIADKEKISVSKLEKNIEQGRAVIPLNKRRMNIKLPAAVGMDLKVKVNANIGGSPDMSDIRKEMEKLQVSVEAGADTVMDLTIGSEWEKILEKVLEFSPVPVGTVPVYAAVCSKKNIFDLNEKNFIRVIEKQADMGVDFMTIHAGVNLKVAREYEKNPSLGGIVSRGGKLIYRWMKKKGRENPFYSRFDRILEIALKHSVCISLGDGLRPGSILDASDRAQFAELDVLGELTQRCREAGVMVMVEGPGHVPLHKIKENVEREKEVCGGAPFYVLGPLTTDIGAGYDHITAAVGGALAAYYGADFLCYVTPSEHLHLPGLKEVREGVIASKIAAHSADIAKGLSTERDKKMSEARRNLDWEKMEKYALDPSKIKESRQKFPSSREKVCTMCGSYCALLEDKNG